MQNQARALKRLGSTVAPRVKTFFFLLPLARRSPLPSRKMLFTRLSLLAFASTLVGTVAGELKIISPGGSTLWWGE